MFKLVAKILFVTVIILTIASCEKRSCKNVTCPSTQQCSEGYCLCLNGFEGSNCDTLSYLKYLGTYHASEVCFNSPTGIPYNFSSYTMNIFVDTSYATVIYLYPLFGIGEGIASIYNTPGNLGNNISVPPQTVGTVVIQQSYGTFYPASGSSKASMIINFNYTYEGLSYNCQETFLKQ